MLFWRGQNLPDESMLAAARIFGVTKEPAARKYQVAGGYKIGGKVIDYVYLDNEKEWFYFIQYDDGDTEFMDEWEVARFSASIV